MFNKKNDTGIIYPVKGKADPRIGPDAIMVMIKSDLNYLVKISNAEKLSFSEMDLYNLYSIFSGHSNKISLAGPFLGAPHAVIALEKMIVLGAKRIWVLGWCGSLQPEIHIGHILIPTSAVSEEGTSRHYPVRKSIESNQELNRILENSLTEKGLSFSKGPIWTTDAVYRETPEKVKTYQNKGVMAVEMEISALMTVALYRSVSLAGLLVVSDELFDCKWRRGFSNQALKKASRSACELVLNIAGSFA
ncbi:MAG TPA: nucleoside phosphorylase [Desulfobacteraceae bacterium]|nr:nucleoside phosphorylase [Desulfobacteraceae bacterium]HPJ69142.1 nucleoside phosphorylase [Desulfobacteraceae bacterium]HPQ29438.1 nucleoside phosphorylase [Desulfobacteraceae bacterium]